MEPFVILMAEDEPTDAYFAQEALKQLSCQASLHVVKDGQAAIDFLRRTGDHTAAPRPHVIILDINMPLKNGYDVLSEIKADPALRPIPVIMLSGSNAEKDVAKSYALHANAFVTKANDFSSMMRLMQAIEAFWFRCAVPARG